MITTKGQLYQWDTGRLIEVYPVDNYKVDEIHVFNGTTKFAPVLETWIDEKNGRTYAKIPDVLLQSDNNMDIYAVMSNDLGEHTQKHINVAVLRRAKPEDYVYTETELETWKKLEKRIKELEENSDTNITVDSVLSTESKNPVQNKVIAKKFNEVSNEIDGISGDLAQLKQQGIIIVQNGSTLTFDNGGGE